MEVSFVPQGTSDNVKGHFGCQSLGVGVERVAVGIWRVEDRDVTKYPTNAQDSPLQQSYLVQNVSSAKVEKP